MRENRTKTYTLLAILCLMLWVVSAQAATVPLAWDDPDNTPADRIVYYVVWQKYGTEWRIATSSNTQQAVLERKNGTYEFVVCAIDAWGYSSEYSAPLRIEVRGNKIRTL